MCKIINSLSSNFYKQLFITLTIAVIGISTSVAIAIPLDKLQYNIVMTSDGYPIIWENNTSNFTKQLSQADLQGLEYCNASANCSAEAFSKGARYYLIQNIAGRGQVIAYYDSNGKLIATQQLTNTGPKGKPSVVNAALQTSTPPTSQSNAAPVGYLDGEFAVTDTGAATYNVPIAIPPGTAGVKPNLSLQYNSQSGEGIAGLGWSLSGLSAISRCSRTRAQDNSIVGVQISGGDAWCIDGQRLIKTYEDPNRANAANGTIIRKYRTEIDSFSDIHMLKRSNGDTSENYFKVYTKAGEIHRYGFDENAGIDLQYLPGKAPLRPERPNFFPRRTAVIDRTEDRLGNYIKFEYTKTKSASYGVLHRIRKISYTGNDKPGKTKAPHSSVEFYYGQTRIQPKKGYYLESIVGGRNLLTKIKVRDKSSSQIRSYNIGYYSDSHELNLIAKQDKVRSIQECGKSDSRCLPPTYFKWDGAYMSDGKPVTSKFVSARGVYEPTKDNLFGSSSLGIKRFEPKRVSSEFKISDTYTGYFRNNDNFFPADFNGDGLTDILSVGWITAEQKCIENRSGNCNLVTSSVSREIKVGLNQNDSINGSSFDLNSYETSNVGGVNLDVANAAVRYPTMLGDVNGDGKIDLVTFNAKDIRVFESDDSGFKSGRIAMEGSTAFTYDFGWRSHEERILKDVNGDGRADLIGFKHGRLYIALSNGYTFNAPTNHDASWANLNFSIAENSIELVDFTSDGLPDIVLHEEKRTRFAVNTSYSDTNHNSRKFILQSEILNNRGNADGNDDHPRVIGDHNGDGNPDILGSFEEGTSTKGYYIAYGTGKGFLPYRPLIGAPAWGTRNINTVPTYFIDINSDGKSDLVNFGLEGVYVYLSNGEGVEPFEVWTSEFGQDTGQKWRGKDLRTFGDFDGDGLVDVFGINDEGVTIGTNQVESLRITGITSGGIIPDSGGAYDGVNRSIDINYERLTAPKNQSIYNKLNNANANQIDVQAPIYVVKAHHSSNGDISYTKTNPNSQKASMFYTYEGLRVDRNGRGSLGFAKRTVKDGITNIRTTRTYNQTFPYIGQTLSEVTELHINPTNRLNPIYRKLSEKKTLASDMKSQVRNGVRNSANWYPKYYNVYIKKTVDTDYHVNVNNLSASPIAFKRTTSLYQDPSKPTEIPVCGNYKYTSTFTEDLIHTENFRNINRNTYPSSSDCFQSSRLITSSVTTTRNNTGTKVRNSAFTYYGSGQIKTEVMQPGHALSTTTSYLYDGYGNVTRKTISGSSISTRWVNTEYGNTGYNHARFPTKITNALGHTEHRTYDTALGTLKTVKGPNGLTTTTKYNEFGQKYLTQLPNKNWIHTGYQWCNLNLQQQNKGRYCTVTTTSEGGYTKTYFDQMDRVVRKQTRSLGNKLVNQDKIYNLDNGQLMRESLPYFDNSQNITDGWVTYTYDKLERTSSVTQPDGGTSSVEYLHGLTTRSTDARGNRKTERLNVLGKPSLVTDALGNTVAYTYFSDGNLATTKNTAISNGIQYAANKPVSTTSFTYDKLGNKATMVDPDMGRWVYTHNGLGELVAQKDAKNQTVSMTYDRLGRLTNRTEKEGSSSWVYDTAIGKGIGKLATVTSPSGHKKTYSYNNYGQVGVVEEKMPNNVTGDSFAYYFTQNIYDRNGRLSRVIYPKMNPTAPLEIEYLYNDSGTNHTGALVGIKNANTGKRYWTLNTVDAKGNVKLQTLGNNVKTVRSYDVMGRVKTIQSGRGGGTALQHLSYIFDKVGNLEERKDQRYYPGATETFGYDSLNRLLTTRTQFSANGIVDTNTMRYDGHGNIKLNRGNTYQYNTSKTHAVSTVGNKTYTYDGNGNATQAGGDRAITWASFNKPVNITKTNLNGKKTFVKLAYNADRIRILKQSTHSDTLKVAKNTWYISGGLVERVETASGDYKGAEVYKFHLKAGGRSIGYINQYKSEKNIWTVEKTRYLLSDHLGSADVVTDEAGAEVLRTSFDAWGKRRQWNWRNTTSSTQLDSIVASLNAEAYKQGFTGHEQDDEVGLVNMKGRLYDSEIGRFISADPHIQAPTDTQSFNRYTYVKNNPLSYTDPSGYFFKKLFKGIGRFLKKFARTIIAIAVAYVTWGASLAAGYSAWAAGAISGGLSGFAATGTLRGAFFGALQGGLAGFVGHGLGGANSASPFGSAKAIAHGVAQGTVTVLQGGKFGRGFVSAFVSNTIKVGKNASTLTKAIVGGTISKITGGKFANGAVTAAFVHLFNDRYELQQQARNEARAIAKMNDVELQEHKEFVIKRGLNEAKMFGNLLSVVGIGSGFRAIYSGLRGSYAALLRYSRISTLAGVSSNGISTATNPSNEGNFSQINTARAITDVAIYFMPMGRNYRIFLEATTGTYDAMLLNDSNK